MGKFRFNRPATLVNKFPVRIRPKYLCVEASWRTSTKSFPISTCNRGAKTVVVNFLFVFDGFNCKPMFPSSINSSIIWTTLHWEYVALNIELRHLYLRQNAGDRWRHSIFKQVVRAMYVPKKKHKNISIFCTSFELVCTQCFFSTSNLLWRT